MVELPIIAGVLIAAPTQAAAALATRELDVLATKHNGAGIRAEELNGRLALFATEGKHAALAERAYNFHSHADKEAFLEAARDKTARLAEKGLRLQVFDQEKEKTPRLSNGGTIGGSGVIGR